jgi:hypothetical protein
LKDFRLRSSKRLAHFMRTRDKRARIVGYGTSCTAGVSTRSTWYSVGPTGTVPVGTCKVLSRSERDVDLLFVAKSREKIPVDPIVKSSLIPVVYRYHRDGCFNA